MRHINEALFWSLIFQNSLYRSYSILPISRDGSLATLLIKDHKLVVLWLNPSWLECLAKYFMKPEFEYF